MLRLADINAQFLKTVGAGDDLPAMIIIAPRDKPDENLAILPIDSIASPRVRAAIADALLTVTCLEGHMIEQRLDDKGAWPTHDTAADHPDARRCMVYLAQARDGTRACGVQYILKPEHGNATLAPLKVLNHHNVALVDSDLADMTRPGNRAPRAFH
jgi:hypothetical protein